MGKTYRRSPTRIELGLADGTQDGHRKLKNGKVRDGTPTKHDSSCENNGDCPYCKAGRQHKHKRRMAVREDYDES